MGLRESESEALPTTRRLRGGGTHSAGGVGGASGAPSFLPLLGALEAPPRRARVRTRLQSRATPLPFITQLHCTSEFNLYNCLMNIELFLIYFSLVCEVHVSPRQ